MGKGKFPSLWASPPGPGSHLAGSAILTAHPPSGGPALAPGQLFLALFLSLFPSLCLSEAEPIPQLPKTSIVMCSRALPFLKSSLFLSKANTLKILIV